MMGMGMPRSQSRIGMIVSSVDDRETLGGGSRFKFPS